MKKWEKIVFAVFMVFVITFLSIVLCGILLNGAGSDNYSNALLIVFAIIQLTLVTGIFIMAYKFKKTNETIQKMNETIHNMNETIQKLSRDKKEGEAEE